MGFDEFGMTFGNPDFVKYAEAYGATGLRVTEDLDLSQVLAEAKASEGPVLIDCPIDYSENSKLSADLSLEFESLVK
jgi:acetolactate synthase I/II/III large subunit